MIHLRKFENFYVNDNTSVDSDEQEYLDGIKKARNKRKGEEGSVCEPCGEEGCKCGPDGCDCGKGTKGKVWGDEVTEGKKSNVKKPKKEEEKEDTKSKNGLTAKQKKLPIGLQKAILKRMKNK